MGKDWTNSGLSPALQLVMTRDFLFPTMTPVQSATIPLFSQHKDVCVEACTGSGKTLAYLLPLFHKLMLLEAPLEGLKAIVIAPSRELAHQIAEVARKVNQGVGECLDIYCMIGGTSIPEEIKRVQEKPPNLLIATPGRCSDMMGKVSTWSMRTVEILVLDEADRLLDMGFKQTVQSIVRNLPKQRRTGLFSATMSTGVQELIKAGLRNPAFISVKVKSKVSDVKTDAAQNTLPKGLTNYYVTVPSSCEKVSLLVQFLLEHKQAKTIVFFGTCDSANFFHMVLTRLEPLSEHKILRIHGKMRQRQRDKVYQSFEESSEAVLLTTDLISRGIDFPDIDWILQYDPPKSPDSFIHRIGRTARAGKIGQTLLFLRTHEEAYLSFLSKRGVAFSPFSLSQQQEFLPDIQPMLLEDREVYEQAQRAFVSYVRFYQEQELSFLFRWKDLDLGALAHSFCLLRLPRITEILGRPIDTFTPSLLDPNDIQFKDPGKEQHRLLELERFVLP